MTTAIIARGRIEYGIPSPLGIVSLATVVMAAAFAGCSPDIGSGYVPEPTFVNNEGQVFIDGDPILGETLTAEIVDSDGASSPTFQWSADATNIPDATQSTYTLTEDELGSVISVSVQYTDGFGFLEVLTSTPTSVVLAERNVPGSIAISGVPTLGETLTASISDGNGTSGASPDYTWLADGVEIAGASGQTYVLQISDVDTQVTVQAAYTDDAGYEEAVTSPPIGPISATAVNVPATVSIVGSRVVGSTLTASIQDPNGISGPVTYQWSADGMAIVDATNPTFFADVDERGVVLSVTVSFVDDDGFNEGPVEATTGDIIYSAIATGELSLLEAVAAATDGDIIGLADPAGGDNYDGMAEVDFAASNMLIRRTEGSEAVISGPTCIVVSGNNSVVDGLVFERLDWIGGGTCDSNGDASFYLSGSNITVRNCEFRSEAFPRTVQSSDPYHYMALKGVDNIVERNLFQDKDMDNEGSAITMFANTAELSNQGHIIQYNLFRSMPGRSGNSDNRDSTAHALQVGRTTGNDAQGLGLFTIQYNRFDSIQSERRLMRVQSGGNTIRGNTVVNSLGLIALEDGFGSTVTQNVILSGGTDTDDGGISFAPLGHTITDNYINNLATNSSQRAGLFINSDPLDGNGNTAIIGTATLDFTVTVARNSIVNTQRTISFEDTNCGLLAPILDFDDNLVVNQSGTMSINGNENGDGRNAVTDNDFVSEPCALDPASDFDNNHFYSAILSQSGTFDFNGAIADNLVGAEDGAEFTLDDDGLLNAAGASAGIGVDTSILHVIAESEVGPGSTWTAPDTN